MNTGQTMLTLIAMILLSTLILSLNRSLLTSNDTINNNRIDILGISLANSIAEDATSLSFDKNTDAGAAVSQTTQLTPKANLGIDAGESRKKPALFNDIDDYNCYKDTAKIDTIKLPGPLGSGDSTKVAFSSFIRVDYVSANSPEVVASSPTWHKKISIRTFSPKMQDTIKVSSIYSYWVIKN